MTLSPIELPSDSVWHYLGILDLHTRLFPSKVEGLISDFQSSVDFIQRIVSFARNMITEKRRVIPTDKGRDYRSR